MLTTSNAEPGIDSVLIDYAIIYVVVQSINEGQKLYEG